MIRMNPSDCEKTNAGYERVRQTAITRFGNSDSMYVGERIAKVSLLVLKPDASMKR